MLPFQDESGDAEAKLVERRADREPDRPVVGRSLAPGDGARLGVPPRRGGRPSRSRARPERRSGPRRQLREARQPRRDRRRAGRRRHRRPALERALRPPLRGAAARRGEPDLGNRLRAAAEAFAGREAELSRHTTESLEAYELYLRGRGLFALDTEEDDLEARRLFQLAVEKDPRFVQAHLSIGGTT